MSSALKHGLTLVFLTSWLGAADFGLEAATGVKISFAGQPLILGEALTVSATAEPAEPGAEPEEAGAEPAEPASVPGAAVSLLVDPEHLVNEESDGRRVYNLCGRSLGVGYRREVSLAPDGSEVELAVMAHVGAYNEALTGKTITYQLRLPLARFAGCEFTAMTGRASQLREVRGTIRAGQRGRVGGAPLRQIAFTGKGWDLVIDGNPRGINSRGDYPPNNIVGLWDLVAEGDELILSRSYAPKFFGGMVGAHLVFYRGRAADFAVRHTSDTYRYFSDLAPERQYVFGAPKFGAQYTDAGTAPYTAERKFGWLDNPALQVSSYKRQGALYSAVGASGKAVFRMTGLRPGVHIVTVVSGSGWKAAGPFALSCNGRQVATGLTLPAKTVQTVAFPVWLDAGSADLEFSGDWLVSTINAQLLQTVHEDYTFRRGFWRQAGLFEPSVMFSSSCYTDEPEFGVSVSQYPLPELGKEASAPLKSWELPSSHAVFAPGEDWRGQANIGSLGPSNNGTFNEFNTPELIQRRLQELKADNLNVILTNGLLSRHTFPTHLARVSRNLADFVKAGHPLGIKFVDHQDHSLLWDAGSGFRVLVGNMPYLQQTVDGQLTARGFCPSNPAYFDIYRSYLLKHIAETGIDGVMIDEVSFHGLKYCGCAACRQAFTADSGWQIPADECSPDLFNKDSRLWRTWLRWRQKRLGDFWYRLKEAVKTERPDFVIMGYSTHYGMTSTYGSLNQGGALEQSTRGWDFVGTEIMTRNIFANYRSVMSLRQAKGQFCQSAGLPVFGLVYTDGFDWDLMYFGWALNNMLGQVTWEMTGHYCPPGKSNYRQFTAERGNIHLRGSRNLARVALLFSNQSRDWPRHTSYPPDVLGISQLLNLQHVPHVFVNEAGLRAKVLKDYGVLFVSNAMALSDAQIAAIRDYAEGGGRVYLSNRVACVNENGDLRPEWPFADLLPVEPVIAKARSAELFHTGAAEAEASRPDEPIPGVQTKPQPGPAAVTDWEFSDKRGQRHPALYAVPHGRGMIYYSPLLLGVPAQAASDRTGSPLAFKRQPESEKIAWRILAEVVGGASPWEPVAVPEAVLTSLWHDRGETVVHFLNASGSRLQTGDIVPKRAPAEPFPALSAPLTFVLPLRGVERAYAVSPDFAGEKEVASRPLGDGRFELILPAELLQAYTLVRIRQP